MDKLRGQDASSYPSWKTELADTVRKIEKFAESVKINYLQKGQ
jgi:hypothetical protein